MTDKEVTDIVQSILLQHFMIKAEHFDFNQPLDLLQEDFKILDNLVFLEQLINKEFNQNISLLENISTAFHTPKDIIDLIMKEF